MNQKININMRIFLLGSMLAMILIVSGCTADNSPSDGLNNLSNSTANESGIPQLNRPTIECIDRPEVCTQEYSPVCAQVQVECIRAPCPPVNQTFGNSCSACSNNRVISYTVGACPQ